MCPSDRLERTTLLHGETLLVVTTGDLEDVTLELVAEGLSGDLIVKHQSAIALVVRIVCGWV